jgi:hypothetical protein
MALKKADDGAKTLHNLSGRKKWQVLFSIRRLNANPTLGMRPTDPTQQAFRVRSISHT